MNTAQEWVDRLGLCRCPRCVETVTEIMTAIAAEEREACAAIAKEKGDRTTESAERYKSHTLVVCAQTAYYIEAEIRARKETT